MTNATVSTNEKENKHARTIRTYNDLLTSGKMDDLITYIMFRLRISMCMHGYHYLKRAIAIVADDPKKACQVTKGLYRDLAKEFDTQWTAIERNMRSAIASIECSDEVKEEYIGFAKESYSNTEFITCIAEVVRFNMH